RRRHTICYRDWSSDVCSSDLRIQQSDLNVVNSFFFQFWSCLLGLFLAQKRRVLDNSTLKNSVNSLEAIIGLRNDGFPVVHRKKEIGRASCREILKIKVVDNRI